MAKPIIGVSMDWQEEGSFSPYPHHALRIHYFEAIEAAGGIPVAIPALPNLASDYIQMIDALLLPGGDFNTPKHWYIDEQKSAFKNKSNRLEMDIKLIELAFEKDTPTMGVCAGMQLLAATQGGKLTKVENLAPHTGIPKEEMAHSIRIEPTSLLYQFAGNKEEMRVNSAHKEAVAKAPPSALISGIAQDGIIEAIEFPKKKFIIGVQWHPEHCYKEDLFSFHLFKGLINATGKS